VRSAPRHAACFAQTSERQLCLPLADGAGRFFKLVFLIPRRIAIGLPFVVSTRSSFWPGCERIPADDLIFAM
jgi:hypothetical protein